MSGAPHTAGPWRVAQAKPTKTRGITILAGYGQSVAHVPVPPAYMSEHPEQANARLIAAAPELLTALRGVLAVADRKTDEFDAARAAILKATGAE